MQVRPSSEWRRMVAAAAPGVSGCGGWGAADGSAGISECSGLSGTPAVVEAAYGACGACSRASNSTSAMAPEAPMGWPRASPPPQALTRAGSSPLPCRACWKARPCTAKASCSSTACRTSRSSRCRCSRASVAASAPVSGLSGSAPRLSPPSQWAAGVMPCRAQNYAEAMSTSAAPSACGEMARRLRAQSGPDASVLWVLVGARAATGIRDAWRSVSSRG